MLKSLHLYYYKNQFHCLSTSCTNTAICFPVQKICNFFVPVSQTISLLQSSHVAKSFRCLQNIVIQSSSILLVSYEFLNEAIKFLSFPLFFTYGCKNMACHIPFTAYLQISCNLSHFNFLFCDASFSKILLCISCCFSFLFFPTHVGHLTFCYMSCISILNFCSEENNDAKCYN